VNTWLVNWHPWSVWKISGPPSCVFAFCTASRQKSVVNALKTRHANILREAPAHRNVGVVSSSTCSGRKMAQVRMISWGVAKPRHVFGRYVQAMDGGVQLALGIPGPVRLLGQVLAQQACWYSRWSREVTTRA